MGHIHVPKREMTQCRWRNACLLFVACGFFNVIIPFSCVALWCSDKWNEENTLVCCCLRWATLTLPGQDMTQCRNMVWFGAGWKILIKACWFSLNFTFRIVSDFSTSIVFAFPFSIYAVVTKQQVATEVNFNTANLHSSSVFLESSLQ